MTFQVCAEDHSGRVTKLARGYATRELAEDHRVVMRKWRRVWVEPEDVPAKRGRREA